ncbi:MAG: DNA primase [Acidobacteriota bacterium]
MRIPRGFSDEVRQQADIVRIVSDYVSLKKRGANHWACCPFHSEKSPSFSVNGAKQFFKCFGCGKAGDVFTFVMEIESSPFPEAVTTVAAKMGIPIPEFESSREQGEADRRRADLLQLNKWATEFFEQMLTTTAEGRRGLEYLNRRGLTEETRARFRIGYAPQSWEALGNHLRQMGAARHQIEASGLVTLRDNGSGFYDRFRSRLIFPITDAQGRIIAFGGRIIGEGEPKYLNSPETSLYTKGQHLFGLYQAREAMRQRGYAILVEGYLDFLVPYQAGVRNLVASLGTALTEHQVRLLGRYVRQIIVNFDPDSAGVAATRRSLEVLLANGFKVNVLTLPENLDPDEYVGKYGGEAYLNLLRSSSRFLDYIVEQAIRAHDQTTPGGKVETINDILPYLRLVRDRIEQIEYVGRIADRLRIDSRLIREEFRKAVETRQDRIRDQVRVATLSVKRAERTLLELILADPETRRAVLAALDEDDYRGLRTARLFEVLIEMQQQGVEPTWTALTEAVDDEDLTRELLPELLSGNDPCLLPEVVAAKSPDILPEMTPETINERKRKAYESLHGLRCDRLIEQQAALQMEINQAERRQDQTALDQLHRRKFELAKLERELTKWSSR